MYRNLWQKMDQSKWFIRWSIFYQQKYKVANFEVKINLRDYSDAYIVMKGWVSVRGTNDANRRNKKLTFKNNAPFRSCISEINNTFVDNAEDDATVKPLYNLLEYSDNYSMASGSLWNYYRDEVNDYANENVNNFRISNKTTAGKSLAYKTKIIEKMPADDNTLDTEVVVPLKNFSNFWRFLNLILINCEIELDLSW